MPKSIVVNGRRWFQRSYGNTYHSVDVYVDGEHVGSSGKVYGYEDSYLQTAIDILKSTKVLPDATYPLSLYCRDNGIVFANAVSDVAREKDL